MQATKHGQDENHILVCLSSSPSNGRLVQIGGEMAEAFRGTFTALYVQTPGDAAMNTRDSLRLQANMRLAQEYGAEIVTTHGEDVATQIAEYARLSGVTRIVIGRSGAQSRLFWPEPTLTDRLVTLAPEVTIHIIPDKEPYRKYGRARIFTLRPSFPTLGELLLTVGFLTIATIIGWLFLRFNLADSNIIMVYLLGVLFTSTLTSGYTCGVLSAFLSVILFNYFLTEPRLSLVAYGSKYPMTFAVMLGAALLTGTLAAKLKAHAQLSARDAYRTKILFDTNQQLQKAGSPEEIYQMAARQMQRLMRRDILIYPAQDGEMGEGTLYSLDGGPQQSLPKSDGEEDAIRWVLTNRKHAGATTKQFPRAKYLYLPLCTHRKTYGVIGIGMAKRPWDIFEYSISLSILGECALALDNLRNAREKEDAAVLAKNEQLRANLLRSISHDLRTPLTSIAGNADTLLHSYDVLDKETQRQIFIDIYDDSQWLIELVENLLSITKIANGSIYLHVSDQVVDDIISEALRHIDRKGAAYNITIDGGPVPLLVRVDAGLIVQVLVNLVNNAIKYSPPGSTIGISARQGKGIAEICVSDHGCGIPDAFKERVFEMFFTGGNSLGDSRRSLGLGLTLCQAIVRAHHGEIKVKDNTPDGCIFSFTLPLSEVNLNE